MECTSRRQLFTFYLFYGAPKGSPWKVFSEVAHLLLLKVLPYTRQRNKRELQRSGAQVWRAYGGGTVLYIGE
jgi:hypothetical protein